VADLTLEGVGKRYGDVAVVRELNLDVGTGELVALVGPSGCGKTTTLRLIAGLERPTSGDIRIDGRSVVKVPAAKRDVAMVFQEDALHPHMTVAENLGFPLRLRKVPRDVATARVRSVAASLGIERLLDRGPRALSGGERQRVAIGRALVRSPRIFLMDEPLSDLDAELRAELRDEVRRIQAETKTTTVYVTHDQVEAMTLGHRVAVMRDGAIAQVAAPSVLYHEPADIGVARAIGTPPMNLLVGRFVGGAARLSVEVAGQQFPLHRALVTSDLAARAGAHPAVTVGVRPEDLLDAAVARHHPTDRRLRIAVERVESIGPDLHVYGRLAHGEKLVVRLDGRSAPRAGEPMELGVMTERLHLFDAETGVRVA